MLFPEAAIVTGVGVNIEILLIKYFVSLYSDGLHQTQMKPLSIVILTRDNIYGRSWIHAVRRKWTSTIDSLLTYGLV
jgi:hypothetical protein